MSTPLTHTLDSYTIPEMVADFDEFNATFGVLPEPFTAVFASALEDLASAASARGVRDVAALLSAHQALLRHLSGTPNLTARHSLATRDRIHLLRNVLLTAVLGAGHVARVSTDGVSEAVITLTRRTQQTDRPLEHDEIALLRTHAAIAMQTPRTSQAAAVYALCDAGAELREVSAVMAHDLDDVTAPTLVHAAGYGRRVESRVLPLETFHMVVVGARATERAQAGQAGPIAYNARSNEACSVAALSSAHGVIDRQLEVLGLRHADVTASSVRRWRIAYTVDTAGVEVAAEIAGLPERYVPRLANRVVRADETEVRTAEDDDF
ncbi:hypothetical protein [Cellulomonas endometrii]|uniref:hypothetical protein n=1 Tax=Cellulomonas endometrii TaxID=3036301 RepID=UPI0024AD898D|nr:hypothetical protein [Cellulomonas endometrii]